MYKHSSAKALAKGTLLPTSNTTSSILLSSPKPKVTTPKEDYEWIVHGRQYWQYNLSRNIYLWFDFRVTDKKVRQMSYDKCSASADDYDLRYVAFISLSALRTSEGEGEDTDVEEKHRDYIDYSSLSLAPDLTSKK